jgi:peptidoglycan/xylan/chitin deacetylase (PgdA/CDA1 family)
LLRPAAESDVFHVGRDAVRPENAAPRKDASAGHEVGNHSFDHEPWLHRKTKTEIEADIARLRGRRRGDRRPAARLPRTGIQLERGICSGSLPTG